MASAQFQSRDILQGSGWGLSPEDNCCTSAALERERGQRPQRDGTSQGAWEGRFGLLSALRITVGAVPDFIPTLGYRDHLGLLWPVLSHED